MKVKVKVPFVDKYTRERHKKGDVLKIKKDRYEEILKVGDLVEVIEAEKTPKKREEAAE